MTLSNALPPRTLKASGLACRRGERQLFAGLDFEIGAGEMLLLRGPNGSGKTSLLLILAGLLRQDEGRHELLGGEDGSDLHFLGHAAAVSGRLTVLENLRFWSSVCGGESGLVEGALQAVGLAAVAELEADLLSAGQTRRLALGRLLCAERPVWLLDEPTSTLDSAGERLVVSLLDAHLQRGGLVVAATHHDLPLRGPTRVRTLQLGSA